MTAQCGGRRGRNTWKSAKSTLKVRKKTTVFIGKILVCVALCDNSNNKSKRLYISIISIIIIIPCK